MMLFFEKWRGLDPLSNDGAVLAAAATEVRLRR